MVPALAWKQNNVNQLTRTTGLKRWQGPDRDDRGYAMDCVVSARSVQHNLGCLNHALTAYGGAGS